MIYLDASVLFSLYFRDSNTHEAMRLVASTTEVLLVSALCEIETINAFGLRVFRGEMSERNVDKAVKDLESNLHSGIFQWKPFSDATFTRAKMLSRKITPTTGVRAADLLHIAAAIELGVAAIYTFDSRQRAAAQAAGLLVN
jgi:predicted nucleic acid-binding protein